MVLVANKVDLVHLRKVTNEQGCEMAAKHNVSPSDIKALLYVRMTIFSVCAYVCVSVD